MGEKDMEVQKTRLWREKRRSNIKRPRKRKGFEQRESRILRRFYLFQIILFAVFLLLFGVTTAKKGSENTWRGTQTPRVTGEEVFAWFETKWDLFFDAISDTING